MNLLEKLHMAAASSGTSTQVIGIDLATTNSTVAQGRLPLPESSSAECVPLEQATQMSPFSSNSTAPPPGDDSADASFL
jgi:hypothetical protein